jgi:hypothetical protein
MSSFSYGKHSDKHIGIWLRYESNDDLIELINETNQMRLYDSVSRVIVSEYDENTKQVHLQVWCKNLIDSIMGKIRYNVFYIKTDINEEWVCEGDLGSGINF